MNTNSGHPHEKYNSSSSEQETFSIDDEYCFNDFEIIIGDQTVKCSFTEVKNDIYNH